MQKYGFKEGQGLGKHEQGLSTALSVEKTSKRGGKIIIGDAAEKRKSSSSAAFSSSGSTFTPASVGDMIRLVLGRLFHHDLCVFSSIVCVCVRVCCRAPVQLGPVIRALPKLQLEALQVGKCTRWLCSFEPGSSQSASRSLE